MFSAKSALSSTISMRKGCEWNKIPNFVLDTDLYLISGGWFDRKGLSPIKVNISGCTWGGNIIKVDTLAACGLRLEFGNRVLTTTIQKVSILRASGKN